MEGSEHSVGASKHHRAVALRLRNPKWECGSCPGNFVYPTRETWTRGQKWFPLELVKRPDPDPDGDHVTLQGWKPLKQQLMML